MTTFRADGADMRTRRRRRLAPRAMLHGTSGLGVLAKCDKGAAGQALADLLYVTKLELAP
jgi:hypothetical protein